MINKVISLLSLSLLRLDRAYVMNGHKQPKQIIIIIYKEYIFLFCLVSFRGENVHYSITCTHYLLPRLALHDDLLELTGVLQYRPPCQV